MGLSKRIILNPVLANMTGIMAKIGSRTCFVIQFYHNKPYRQATIAYLLHASSHSIVNNEALIVSSFSNAQILYYA